MLTRFPDWQVRLDRYLTESRVRPFGYGSWDCCLMVCDAVAAMTGIDLAAPLRGKYSTRREALEALRLMRGSCSVRGAIKAIAAASGLERCPISIARRGDVVLIERRRDSALGLVSLTGRDIVVLTAGGLARAPLEAASGAFHV